MVLCISQISLKHYFFMAQIKKFRVLHFIRVLFVSSWQNKNPSCSSCSCAFVVQICVLLWFKTKDHSLLFTHIILKHYFLMAFRVLHFIRVPFVSFVAKIKILRVLRALCALCGSNPLCSCGSKQKDHPLLIYSYIF